MTRPNKLMGTMTGSRSVLMGVRIHLFVRLPCNLLLRGKFSARDNRAMGNEVGRGASHTRASALQQNGLGYSKCPDCGGHNYKEEREVMMGGRVRINPQNIHPN